MISYQVKMVRPIHIESSGLSSNLPDAIQNKSLSEVMNWKKTGVNCIGIKNKDGKFLINPPEETIIEKGMKVIVLGTNGKINLMKGNLG